MLYFGGLSLLKLMWGMELVVLRGLMEIDFLFFVFLFVFLFLFLFRFHLLE